MDIDLIKDLLKTERMGRSLYFFPTLHSTNRYALEKACSGELKAGDVVLAETQTAGYGRQGSVWHSPSGAGLWFSVVLNPDSHSPHLSIIALIGASSVLCALRNIASADWMLKWPNDIYANNKKAAGLIAETRSRPIKARALVLGIGINVNQSASQFHPDIRDRAVSLAMIKGSRVSRELFLADLLKNLEQTFDLMQSENAEQTRKEILDRHEIFFNQDDCRFKGRISSFEPDGSLIVRSENGQTIRIDQGERRAIQPACN